MSDYSKEEIRLVGQFIAAVLVAALSVWFFYQRPHGTMTSIAFIIAFIGLALNSLSWFGMRALVFSASAAVCGSIFALFLSL